MGDLTGNKIPPIFKSNDFEVSYEQIINDFNKSRATNTGMIDIQTAIQNGILNIIKVLEQVPVKNLKNTLLIKKLYIFRFLLYICSLFRHNRPFGAISGCWDPSDRLDLTESFNLIYITSQKTP